MAPEICRASSGLGRFLRLEKPNRHATLQSGAGLAPVHPYPQTTQVLETHGIRPPPQAGNSRVQPAVGAATMGACAPTS